MGFYGNITNTNKTQFTFDRTYSSRWEMERLLATDGIYLGRYVLVEYDLNTSLDAVRHCYTKMVANEERFYSSPNCEEATRLRWGATSTNNTIASKELIYVEKDITPDDGKNQLSTIFYICTNIEEESSAGDYATFRLITSSESNYTKNYNIAKYDETTTQSSYEDKVHHRCLLKTYRGKNSFPEVPVLFQIIFQWFYPDNNVVSLLQYCQAKC